MRNNMLIHHAIHNSVASGNGAGCPRYIREHLLDLLQKHSSEDLWNPYRMNQEDAEELADIIEELGLISMRLDQQEKQIINISIKYWENSQKEQKP